MDILWMIVSALPVLCVLIVVHEFGHFIVAKWCGVGVVKFSVGFGKVLWKRRKAETDYQICAIPLGGYVRMVGDIPDPITGEQESDKAVRDTNKISGIDPKDVSPELERMLKDKSYWFLEKNLWQKSAIVAAGPIFNFIFAVLVIAAVVFFFGKPTTEPLYGKNTEKISAIIGEVGEGSPAQIAGIQKGDKVLSINGQGIADWEALSSTIKNSSGAKLDFLVQNQSGEQRISVSPKIKELKFGKEVKQLYLVGISPILTKEVGLLESMKSGVVWTANATKFTCIGIYRIFTGKESAKEIGGPILIFSAAGQQAQKGLEHLLDFVALLSVSLAVLNLLPIPVLDGGHLLFFLIEGLFGSMSIKTKEIAQSFGLVVILGLMLLGLFNDLTREPLPEQNKIEWDSKESSQAPVKTP